MVSAKKRRTGIYISQDDHAHPASELLNSVSLVSSPIKNASAFLECLRRGQVEDAFDGGSGMLPLVQKVC